MIRPFLIHSCWHQPTDYTSWKTTKHRPKDCRCRFRVSRDEADYLLNNEVIMPLILGWSAMDGRDPIPTYSDSIYCFTKKAVKTPRVQTIEKAHIERAYIDGNKNDISRIIVWGELAANVRLELMAPWRPDPFEGRSLLFVHDDERTSVGTSVARVPREEQDVEQSTTD